MDQASRGKVPISTEEEAKARLPNLSIASLGAIKKDKPNGVVMASGIMVNKRTRMRDQERAPISSDLKRLMRENATGGPPTFPHTADVAEAHRQVPARNSCPHCSDVRRRLGLLLLVEDHLTTWTSFPISCLKLSANAARACCRRFSSRTRGEGQRSGLFILFVLCATAGVPLSWIKTAGGDIIVWVGFELVHTSYPLGISQRRPELFAHWTRDAAWSDYVHLTTFEEGLGRVMYVVGALEYERPFLSPLNTFLWHMLLCLYPRGSVRRVLAYVSLLLSHLSCSIATNRHYSCAVELRPSSS